MQSYINCRDCGVAIMIVLTTAVHSFVDMARFLLSKDENLFLLSESHRTPLKIISGSKGQGVVEMKTQT